MKQSKLFQAVAVSVFFLVFTAGQFAGSMDSGEKKKGAMHYDPATVETISGEVVAVEKKYKEKYRGHGVHLQVKTSSETLKVHLGPSWYLEKQAVQIQKGDKVSVTGSRMMYDGKSVIIASEVKKGDKVLRLRNPDGTPLWSRGGK